MKDRHGPQVAYLARVGVQGLGKLNCTGMLSKILTCVKRQIQRELSTSSQALSMSFFWAAFPLVSYCGREASGTEYSTSNWSPRL